MMSLSCLRSNSHHRRKWWKQWQHHAAFMAVAVYGSVDYKNNRTIVSAEEDNTSNANPLLEKTFVGPASDIKFPRFKDVQPHHLKSAADKQLKQMKYDFDTLIHDINTNKAKDYSAIVDQLDSLKAPLESTLAIVDHLLMVNQTDEMKFAHGLCLTPIVQCHQEVMQSPDILLALQKITKDSKLWSTLTSAQRKVVCVLILEMERNGVGLSEAEKVRFNDIQVNLSHLQAKFNSNVLKSSQRFKITLKKKSSVEQMPQSLRRLLAQNAVKDGFLSATAEEGPWVVNPDCYQSCIKHLKSRKMREVLYKAQVSRATTSPIDNTSIIQEILINRKQIANLLGFNNYADMSLDSKMAPNVKAVLDLLETLKEEVLPLVEKEMCELNSFVKLEGGEVPLEPWDIPFWSERLKENKFQIKEEDVVDYFPLESVLNGLFKLFEKLFNVRVVEYSTGQHQTWHPDVRVFHIHRMIAPKDVSTGDQAPIAVFYLDPYSRPQRKKEGNWMNPVVTRSKSLQQVVPVAHLVLNISPPLKGDEDTLMTLTEVETLFHEFGHGLQHLLTTVDHAAISGVKNIAWDAIEFPSQFMENWVYDQSTIRNIAKHHLTGDPLPNDMFEKVLAAKNFQAGRNLLHQVHLAALDLALHSQYDPLNSQQSAMQFLHGDDCWANRYLYQPQHSADKSLCSFNHIFTGGYAAGYYSYLWAEVMSADAFSSFQEADSDSAIDELGVRFRDTVLAQGGECSASQVFRDFKGRDTNPAALLRERGVSK